MASIPNRHLFPLLTIVCLMTIGLMLMPSQPSFENSSTQSEQAINTAEYRAERYRSLITYGLAFATIAVCAGFWIHKSRMRRKETELAERLLEIDTLSAEFRRLEKELQDTSAKNASTIDSDSLRCIEQFYHSQIAIIDRISAEYFEKKDAAIPIRLTILQQLDESLHAMQTPQTSNAIISLVNLNHNHILAKIKSEMPKLKPTDIEFIALKLAGFSPKAIALFQGLTLGNYYNRWTRLRARIGNSDAAHKEQILSLLNATVKSH